MESILQDSFVNPRNLITNKSPETQKLKVLRLLNIILLMVFALFWSLNFIWVGWDGAYTAIMIFSWIFGVTNCLFVIGSHNQRLNPFKWASLMIFLYIIQLFAVGLSVAFITLGSIDIHEFSSWDGASYIKPADYKVLMTGKWKVLLSVLFLVQSFSFVLYLKEFKGHYIDVGSNSIPVVKEVGTDEDEEAARREEKY